MNVYKSLNSYIVGYRTIYLPWVGLALWPSNSSDYSRGLFYNIGPEGGEPFYPIVVGPSSTVTFVSYSALYSYSYLLYRSYSPYYYNRPYYRYRI